METILTKKGRIKKTFLPAAYFDTSVVIDYWSAEGLEVEIGEQDILFKEPSHSRVVREIIRSEARMNKVVQLRKKLIYDEISTTPVITPLCMLELMEWHAQSGFKNLVSDVAGVLFVQKKSRKQVGDYLKKALELRKNELQKQKGKVKGASTGLEIVMDETWLNGSFAKAHGLVGLWLTDVVNFKLTEKKIWQEPSAYAYLQLGIADIMHILFAQHLGCKYLVSFDSDFERIKDIVFEETGIRILTKPDDILSIF
jgi:hypothetical protein